jgi:hypothetical protein
MIVEDEKFIRFWEPNSQKGRQAYAIAGALLFSMLFGIFKELAYWLVFDRSDYTFKVEASLLNILFIFIIMYFYKRWEWNKNEKRYQELNKSKP